MALVLSASSTVTGPALQGRIRIPEELEMLLREEREHEKLHRATKNGLQITEARDISGMMKDFAENNRYPPIDIIVGLTRAAIEEKAFGERILNDNEMHFLAMLNESHAVKTIDLVERIILASLSG